MKFAYVLSAILFITICVHFSHQLGSGAPNIACTALTPNHRENVPQISPSPYVLTPYLNIGTGNVLIRISATDRSLAGFLIQGRRVTDNTTVGSFVTPFAPALYQTLTCVTVADSATHTNPQLKSEVVLEWIPPIGFSGQVYFTGTVLQEFSTFWSGVRSPIFTI